MDAGGGGNGVYVNPVIPGDFPDPSVIKVGAEYWATATSSEWGPIFPILRSTDLVTWQLVGSVFQERPAWSVASYWAPEIQEDNGRFHVFYSARGNNGPLCVAVASAPAPAGPYEDHGPLVCQPVGSIDGFSIRDERGTRHLIWKEDGNSVGETTRLWAQELSEDSRQLLGERAEILQNDNPWEGDLVEGPFVLRRGGMFHLFYAGAGCCGIACTYAIGTARARALLGPWEKSPHNPVLAANAEWQCPGHGSVVGTGDGRYFLLYHAYSASGGVYAGRQGMLDEVVFGADGWPLMRGGVGPSSGGPAPIAPQARRDAEIVDELDRAALAPDWQWLVATGPPAFTLDTSRGGRLVLGARPPVPGNGLGALLAQRTRAGDYEATAEVEAGPGVSAGLAAVGDGDNAVGISLVSGRAVVWRLSNGTSEALAEEQAAARAALRMTVRGGHVYSFAVRGGAAPWVPVGGPVDSQAGDVDLPPWDRGVRVGLVASGPAGATASFESLRVVAPVSNP